MLKAAMPADAWEFIALDEKKWETLWTWHGWKLKRNLESGDLLFICRNGNVCLLDDCDRKHFMAHNCAMKFRRAIKCTVT